MHAISAVSVVKIVKESMRAFMLGWPEVWKVWWDVGKERRVVVSLLSDEVALVCGVEIRSQPVRLDDIGIC